ncbi:hypothetical protein BROUX41_003198 [Berkeleyomyces rouxiae]|uniref:uncharacterized protein n=1 Tax=Berkeleyomyces rouxiae TaxID=2035830 RepID=UPI003B75FF8E
MAASQSCHEALQLTDVIANSLVLDHILPYLSAYERLRLASTSRYNRWLLMDNTHFFRHLDMGTVKTINFKVKEAEVDEFDPNAQIRDYLTEDDFMSGPIRGIFSFLRRANFLNDIQTLILDGLPVTADVCHEILTDPSFNVRILSIRGVKSLNERKLCDSLRTACRQTRPKGTPRLKGLYVFGAPDNKERSGTTADAWYHKRGQVIQRNVVSEWGATLQDCRDVLAFDSVLCKGPAHANSPVHGCYNTSSITGSAAAQWAVATYSLGGCAGCGSAPEGLTYCDKYTPASDMPMISPPPLLTSTVRAATLPCAETMAGAGGGAPDQLCFVARCEACVRGRMCRCCNKWYCEECYPVMQSGPHVEAPAMALAAASEASSPLSSSPASVSSALSVGSALSGLSIGSSVSSVSLGLGDATPVPMNPIARQCIECGFNCLDCFSAAQKRCDGCGDGYCLKHHEGSSSHYVSCPAIDPPRTSHADLTYSQPVQSSRTRATTAHTAAVPIPHSSASVFPTYPAGRPRQHTEAWSQWMSRQRAPIPINARPMHRNVRLRDRF